MKFKRFSKIESVKADEVYQIVREGLSEGEFVATEKLHGSNFGVWLDVDTDEVKFSKRSAFLEEDEKFFDYEVIADELAEKIRELRTLIHEGSLIVVYGELIGGLYKHPEVEKPSVSMIQKGIHYCPTRQYFVFDVKVDGEFLPHDRAVFLAEEAGFHVVPEIARGPLQEVLLVDVEFQTRIPDILGLPVRKEVSKAEGVVIRPVEPRFLRDGDRVILKKKAASFQERQKQPAKVKVPESLSEEVTRLIDAGLEFCTAQRLECVISKMGSVSIKDFAKVISELNLDTLIDFEKEFGVELDNLEKKDRKVVTKQIGRENSILLKKYFQDQEEVLII